MPLTQDDLLRMYRMMLLIRRFEERATQYFMNGQIRGSFHPCIGQEATAVGGCFALRQDDYMTCTYRGHGQSLAKGLDAKEAMAELLGRRTGCSKGKGGSMHFTDPRIGLLGENAIVGAGAAIINGAALTARLDGTDQVGLTFFGDGATNQGVFFEALNLAAIWQLPVIFFCENNLYSEMTPIRDMVRTDSLADRAGAFGMATAVVDGYDPLAVYDTTLAAVERARAGGGPTFIEAMTYRLVGHMVGDSEPYRTKEEVAEWRARDPIVMFPRRLVAEFGVSEQQIGAIDAAVAAEIEEIARFAEQSPWPEPHEAAEDMWA
ncbi:MAG: Acetoin:2,6-dichlorophenolindophenol oxidoreductase subunit alpha [Chloroflexi bacterium ADurb.Bin325]|nr:MAG: Acetoin:2,6-dichlorophenolindophenol oxidoreductase subunit alpha [Chloroflexi bacterium ADurb.Bin325]